MTLEELVMMTEIEVKRAGYKVIRNNNMFGCRLRSKSESDPNEFATEEELFEYINEKENNQEL